MLDGPLAVVAHPHPLQKWSPPVIQDLRIVWQTDQGSGARGVTAFLLVFEANEHGPSDDLRLQFKAIGHMRRGGVRHHQGRAQRHDPQVPGQADRRPRQRLRKEGRNSRRTELLN
ncbi:hypothetical protein [Trinickia fusca]|uniref:hypothetical protein n=1 Tax=Trinickia fusca TaxID=2419777 RepID=UPI0011C447E6|nr:hypothetical protein [Trinickia fusca]